MLCSIHAVQGATGTWAGRPAEKNAHDQRTEGQRSLIVYIDAILEAADSGGRRARLP